MIVDAEEIGSKRYERSALIRENRKARLFSLLVAVIFFALSELMDDPQMQTVVGVISVTYPYFVSVRIDSLFERGNHAVDAIPQPAYSALYHLFWMFVCYSVGFCIAKLELLAAS